MPSLSEMGSAPLCSAAIKTAWNPFPKKAEADTPLQPDAWIARRPDAMPSSAAGVSISLSDGIAHSQVGCTRSACVSGSGFFARMFDGAWKEGLEQATCQQVPNLKVGEAVLKYLQGEPLPLDENNVVDAAVMADYWDIPHLRGACEAYIDQNLTDDNLSELFAASCKIGEATASFTTHIWQVAGMLSLASPVAPENEACQWLDEHPSLLPIEAKTVARSKPVLGAPGSYQLQVRWFEPNVLPRIRQGKSATFTADGLQWHIKRIVKRKGDAPSHVGFELRVHIPSNYPSQGSCFEAGQLQAINQFAFNYTLVPDLDTPKQAQEQVADCSDSECGHVKANRTYIMQALGRPIPALYQSGTSSSNDGQPKPTPSTVSDDENDAFRPCAFENYYDHDAAAERSSRSVSLRHAANAAVKANMRLWEVPLNDLELSHHQGILRADGSQFFQLDGIFKAVPLGEPYTRSVQAYIANVKEAVPAVLAEY